MLLALLAVVVVSIGVVVLMAWLGKVRPNTLLFEIAQALLQVGLVSAAGIDDNLVLYEYIQRCHSSAVHDPGQLPRVGPVATSCS